MRLVFVHGINNETYTVKEIETRWMTALQAGWQDLGLTPKKSFTVHTAYYADTLAQASTQGNAVVEMGDGQVSSGLAIEFLRTYAEEAGITEEELQAAAAEEGLPLQAVAQGVPHEGWVIAFANVLERLLPTKGKYIAKLFLKQASVYIGDPALAAKIDAKVKEQVLEDKFDSAIVIGHSLGSVVSYRLLASESLANYKFPLFVTLGSPLSVAIFRPILPKRGTLPTPPIQRWINGRNKEDFITLGKAIVKKSIGFDGVEDITEVIDNKDNRHDIVAYLRSPKIAQAIYDAIHAQPAKNP
ncbi:Uncharacterised protein [Delftia tsuruhatensis]|uniref:hypothetical protein n=1 Tax=Delftia tsuruhatensis TaxID=180282 RepID=UPI001E74F09E|nr:hypothetical protein [Delftia tsuruhatensis]CAB5671151.1 Uncharacterised protein [Delftia tsuruhatensis]CAC9683157.1 Uncharacterised protein [Delftia tsuruhatensis]